MIFCVSPAVLLLASNFHKQWEKGNPRKVKGVRLKEMMLTETQEKEETQKPKAEGNRPDQLVAFDTTILAAALCLFKQDKLSLLDMAMLFAN